jgi:hypothetical protein
MPKSVSNRVLLWSVLAAVPGSLHAAADVIFIDQNAATAGSVTPGDSPGFPVVISQSGSYRLTSNLTVPDENTTAIQITAGSVTLDLKGFSIIGPVICKGGPTTCPAPGTGSGVQVIGTPADGPRGVRILNGSVHGMGLMGVQLTGGGSFVERVTAYSNAGGGMAVAGQVLESAATLNGSFGILAGTVRHCNSSENAGDGIILNGEGGIASDNVSSLNGGYGISAPYSTVTGNSLFLNQSFGISAHCPSSIIANTIVSSSGSNLETVGTGCVLVNNAARQ